MEDSKLFAQPQRPKSMGSLSLFARFEALISTAGTLDTAPCLAFSVPVTCGNFPRIEASQNFRAKCCKAKSESNYFECSILFETYDTKQCSNSNIVKARMI